MTGELLYSFSWNGSIFSFLIGFFFNVPTTEINQQKYSPLLVLIVINNQCDQLSNYRFAYIKGSNGNLYFE